MDEALRVVWNRIPRLPRLTGLHIYAFSMAVAALAFIVVVTIGGDRVDSVPAIACLAVVAIVAERSSVRLNATTEVSILFVPTLFAAVLFGPLDAMIVAAASMIADRRHGASQPYLKILTYTSTRVLTAGLAGVTALVFRDIGGMAGIALATVVAAVVGEFADTTFAAATCRLRRNGTMGDIFRAVAPLVAAAVPLYAPIVALVAAAYEEVSPWTLPLFLVPALAAQRLFVLYQDQRTLTEEMRVTNGRLERANVSFAAALVATLEARDEYTAGHSEAVAKYAAAIAQRMGLSEQDQARAQLAGLVHDIGKIGLSPNLLEKRGPLTLPERRAMEAHSEIGERILANVDDYEEVARIVRHHHERWDGHGYPDKLTGEQIPVIARIIAVADAYDAMTSDRPYREAMPSRVARLRLAQAVESQFDTTVVAAFEAILAATDAPRDVVLPPRLQIAAAH